VVCVVVGCKLSSGMVSVVVVSGFLSISIVIVDIPDIAQIDSTSSP